MVREHLLSVDTDSEERRLWSNGKSKSVSFGLFNSKNVRLYLQAFPKLLHLQLLSSSPALQRNPVKLGGSLVGFGHSWFNFAAWLG